VTGVCTYKALSESSHVKQLFSFVPFGRLLSISATSLVRLQINALIVVYMENVAFIEMDDNTKPAMDNGQVKAEDDDENKPSNRRSSRKYSVTRKEATMELSELSKHSRYTYGDSTESLIHIAVRQGRSSLLHNEITKAKENDNIDGLDNVGFAALHHTTRYNGLSQRECTFKRRPAYPSTHLIKVYNTSESVGESSDSIYSGGRHQS